VKIESTRIEDALRKAGDASLKVAEQTRQSLLQAEEQRKQLRLQEEEIKRLKSLPPLYVVHTVHGTYAPDAPWTKESSSFSEQLKRDLGWRVKIESFGWSGKNSVSARWEAAQNFRRHLEEKLNDKEYVGAKHIIVSHSHGGNVAFWALANEALASRVAGVVTLATPFLSATLRPEEDELIDLGTAIFVGVFVCLAVLCFGFYGGQGMAVWPFAVGAGLASIGLLWIGAWMTDKMKAHAHRICDRMPASAVKPEQTLIVRVQGDEAIAAISGVRLAGNVSDLFWGAVSSRIYSILQGLLPAIDYLNFRSMMRNFNKQYERSQSEIWTRDNRPLSQSSLRPEFLTTAYSASDQFKQSALSMLPIFLAVGLRELQTASSLTQMIVLGIAVLYALPAGFALLTVLLGIPFALLSSISLLPCGRSMIFAGPYLRLMAEPSPPGTWTVTAFHADGNGLAHSAAYQHTGARQYIAEWIKSR
jgi:hypothetical protein